MATQRRRIVGQDLNLGYGQTSIPTDTGGSRVASKIGINTFLKNTFNVCDFGANGDGVTDDTSAFTAALNAAALLVPTLATYTYGTVIVLVPPAIYSITSISVPSGVGMFCPSGVAILKARTTGVLVDTPVINSGNSPHCNGMFIGIDLYGLGAGVPLIGLRINNAQNFVVENCRATNFADSAVQVQSKFDGLAFNGSSTSNTCYFREVRAFNNVLNLSRSTRNGSFDIAGSDHEFICCEAFNPQGRTLSSSSKRCVGWNLIGANECRFVACKGSVHDQGWYCDSNSTVNYFTSPRADSNLAEGMDIEGSYHFIELIDLNGNGQNAANTYDQLVFGSNAQGNRVSSGAIINVANPGTSYRYGVTDNNTAAPVPNVLGANLLIRSSGTGPINNVGQTLSVTLSDGAAQGLTVNSATPSILGAANQPWKVWKTANSMSTTITNFTGGFGGQVITVLFGDGNTYIQNNSNIGTSDGVDILPANGQSFTFRMNDAGTKWIQIGGDNAFSGTYTPTLSNTANVTSSVAFALGYCRVGRSVTVFGRVDITPTAAGGTATQLDMTLPLSTTFSASSQLGGSGSAQATATRSMSVSGNSTKASFQWLADANSALQIYFTFGYTIQ